MWNGTDVREAPEPMKITVPFTVRSHGSSVLEISAGAMTLVANDSRQSSGVASSTVNRGAVAAQCTSTSTRPSGAISSARISAAVSASPKSANTGMTDPPLQGGAAAWALAAASGAGPEACSTTFWSLSMFRPTATTVWSRARSSTISAPIPLEPPVTTATGADDFALWLVRSRTSAFRLDGTGASPPAEYEPATALFGGADGLDLVRRLITESRDWLAPGGVLLIELGSQQQQAATDFAEALGFIGRRTLGEDEQTVVLELRLRD